MRRFAILLSLLLGSVPLLQAQTIPVTPEFGAVTDAEVALTRYEPDTTASVVLLCRKKEISIRLDPDAAFGQYIVTYERWKVLKESGKDIADYEFLYSVNKNNPEKITNIKVNTYNLNANGKVVKTPMSKEFIFDKRYTDNVRRVSFTAENVRVGSVIEVTYERILRTADIEDIYLQSSSFPTNLSIAEVSYPDYFSYNKLTRGNVALLETSRESHAETAVLRAGNIHDYYIQQETYTVRDAPRLRRESYCISPESHRVSIVYDLRSYVILGYVEKYFATDWNQIDYNLQKAQYQAPFRAKFKSVGILQEAIAGEKDDAARIVAVWNLLRESVKWNGRTRMYPHEPEATLRARTGSSADLNALLASALNTIGYTADPVLLSPRSNGDFSENHVTDGAFSAVILRVSTPDRKVYYLDASEDECGYLNLFDSDYLVSKARWLHDNGAGEWVDLTAVRNPNSNSLAQEVAVQIQPETGLLTGVSNTVAIGYPCRRIKQVRDRFSDEDEWIQDTEIDDQIDISVMAMTNEKKRSDKCAVHYEFEKEIDRSGDYLYIPVFLYPWHLDGAFQREKRDTPIDFEFTHRHIYRFVLTIPEGYAIDQLPLTKNNYCSAARQSNYSLRCTTEGNQLVVLFNFNLNTLRVPVSGYSELRSFWEGLGNTERAVVVLKKIQ